MNRRDFGKTLGVIGVGAGFPGAILCQPTHRQSNVEVLLHSPNTRYEILRTYDTKEEAEALVKALMPRLFSITLAVSPFDVYTRQSEPLQSGYRRAVRAIYKPGHIVNTVFEIIDKRNEEVIIDAGFDGVPIFDVGRAWAIIENIRVGGKPVQMQDKGLPVYLIQPFARGENNITYVDLEGKEIYVCPRCKVGDHSMHDTSAYKLGCQGGEKICHCWEKV
jgi:hypothetical protein